MTARSQAQRKWAFGVKGEAWARAHHFDNKGKLPAHAARHEKPQDERARLAEAFRRRGKKKRGKVRGQEA